jgi:NAD(P)-dependent dehydrogenase (short-subunit alcohol dehydrogenase family)
MSRKILITGASSGFGRLTVSSLLENGHKVVGTTRTLTGRNEAVVNELKNNGAHMVEMDVTKGSSVENGVNKAIELLGGLDVVINNAGIGVLGMQEQFTIKDFKQLFDVNVFGVQRVIRRSLPQLRKSDSGLLIFISSLLGRITLPYFGPYNASKWALEALAENYRAELSGFGIESCIVEPGGFATNFMDSLILPTDNSSSKAYGDHINAPQQMMGNFGKAITDNAEQKPENVSEAIAKLVEMPKGEKPFRTVVDKMGMGTHIKPYNDNMEQVTHGIYSAFGMEKMLNVVK